MGAISSVIDRIWQKVVRAARPNRHIAPREPLLVYAFRRFNRPLPPGTTQVVTEPLLGFGVIQIVLQTFDLPLRPALLVVAAVVLATAIMRPLSHRSKGIYWKDDRSPFQDLLLGCRIVMAILAVLVMIAVYGPMAKELFG